MYNLRDVFDNCFHELQIYKNNYHIVSKIDVTNLQDNHQTILEINNLEIDTNIDDDVFQEKNLKRYDKFVQ